MFRSRALLPFLLVSVCLLAAALPAAGGDLIVRSAAPRSAGPEAVRVNASVLADGPDVLWLEPVAGAGRWAYRTGFERHADGGLVWRGRFAADDPGVSTVTLSLHDGVVVGTMTLPHGPTWLLQPSAGGGSLLRSRDPAALTCGVGAQEPAPVGTVRGGNEPPPPGPDPELDKATAAEERDVYVLVLYTPAAAARLGARNIQALARHHADYMNGALANSGIDGRVHLAAAVGADLGLSSGIAQGAALRHAIDHPLARQLHDQWRADVVAVVVDDQTEVPGVCGYANVMFRGLRGPQMADQAFAMIGHDCFSDPFAFTHETAHVFGAQHDPAHGSSPDQAAYPFAFGHGVDGHFFTVMAHPLVCTNCRLLSNVFSNPLRSIDGVPTGIADQRDNARALNLTFPLVASFRSGRPPAPPTPPTAPAAPGDLTATAVSPTEVELAWSDNAGDETGYQVERLTADGWQRIAELAADATAHTVGGLQPETTYRFRVRAVRDGVASAYSGEAAVTTPPALPAAPTGLVAEPLSATRVALSWEPADRASGYELELRGADPAADRPAEPIVLSVDGAVVDGLTSATPYTLRVRGVNAHGVSAWSAPASVTTAGPGGPCAPGASTLCLLGGRFEVRARWRNPRPPFGHGAAAAAAAPGSQRTGVFTFFHPDNVELVVKMLDGRAVNGAHWLFYGALSDVEYWVSVRDTESDAANLSRTYHNPPRELCGRGDTRAFLDDQETPDPAPLAIAPSDSASHRATTAGAEGTACAPGPDALCLAGGRFRVEVSWEDPRTPGRHGAGHVYAGLGGERSGHFWFFRPDNLELAVKILDGRAVNGHFWIFWGALSDVAYTLRVTDTVSSRVYDFDSPALTLCGGAVTDRL